MIEQRIAARQVRVHPMDERPASPRVRSTLAPDATAGWPQLQLAKSRAVGEGHRNPGTPGSSRRAPVCGDHEIAAAMADRHEKVPVINIAQTGLFKWATAPGSAGFTESDGVV